MTKILLVDDEPLVIVTLKSLIDWESYGFEIVAAFSNGQEAFNYISHHKNNVDIMLCDVDMPIINGIELCEKLVKNNIIIKTIFLSSYSNFDYVRSAFQNGAYDYILKSELEETKLLNTLLTLDNSKKDISYNNKKINEYRTKYFLSAIENTNTLISFEDCKFMIDFPLYVLFININDFDDINNKKEIINIIEQETKNFFYNNYNHFMILMNNLKNAKNIINRLGSNLWNYINVSFDYKLSCEIKNERELKIELKNIYDSAHANSRLIYLSRKYIGENFKNPELNISMIAEKVKVSKNHLSREYSKESGETLVEYITKLRIKEAKKLLENTNLKTYEIAEKIGFSNSETFFRTFKKYCGITPKQYKKR